jgi:hypothetical protein
MNGVSLAYSGVHQIFQLALAAHELGELNGLFCSLVDAEGMWGRRCARWLPQGTIRPLGAGQLPSEKLTEYPWPVLVHRLAKRFLARHSDHFHSNGWFDRKAARWVEGRGARVFVGAETCALESLRRAKSLGMRTVLDCPGIPSGFLDDEARLGAEDFGVTFLPPSNSAAMQERKRLELEAADVVLCCSEFQRAKLLERLPEVKNTLVIPLWADVDFWQATQAKKQWSATGTPLRVLYAGAVSLRKGVPYLLDAVEPLASEVRLTLVGGVSEEMLGILRRFRAHLHRPYVTKAELKGFYQEHDVLVMPTLGDSFGFVLLEAMAAGLPVIASANCGAPVPDEGWRVPPHDAEAIRSRLLAYHADRELLRHHGEVAAAFGQGFRPVNYRQRAGELFQDLLAA